MKTKKSIWSIALSLIVILALVLSFGLSAQKSAVKAQDDDHITFNVTVDGVNAKSIESNHSALLVVRYTVTENTGVDAMQLRIDFSSAFTLERIEALKTTSLGEPTINNGTAVEPLNGENYVAYEDITLEENNIYIGANIVYEHVNNRYSATGDTLIIAYYRLNNNPTEGVYPFGFWNANNGDGFSTAWKNVANAEQSGTHTPVIINYADAVVYIRGDYEFTLTGGQKVYDGAPAENSAITVSDNNNQNRPALTYVWFEGISSNSNTYRKLDSNPVNAGQYFVVLEYQATNLYRAYCGYTETEEPGVYTLDSTQGHVATYIITQRSITITATAQSADYTGTEPTVDQSAYTVVDNEDVKLENIASLVSGVNISKVEGVNAGNYTLTPSLVNTNYSITFVNGTFTITPKAITIKIDDKSSKYGAPLAELTWALKSGSTLVEGDTLAGLNVVLATTPADLSNANVGPYPISGAYSNGNYAVTWENGTYTIESVGKDAEYIFSFIEGLTKNYNGSVQDLLNILAQNANEEAKPSWISYTVSNNQQKNAGDYVISVSVTLSQEVADNYTNGVKEFATTVNGKINKIALTITASAEVEYDDLEPFIWVNQGNGWANGENYDTYDEELEMNLEDYVSSNYTRGQNAGTPYTISWNGNAEAYVESVLTNYDVTLAVAQNLTVAKQVVDAEDYDFAGYTDVYDAQNHNLVIENADSKISVSISNKATVKDVADTGVYTATITLADPDNYTFDGGSHEGWTVSGNSASKQAQVTISAKQLEISVNYTDSKTATFSLSGFVGGETAEVLTDLVYSVAGSELEANVYTISEYVASAQTVSATSSNGNYTIKNATLKNIRKVEYVCDHDLGANMPADELLFDGFKAVQPEAVSLTHYTFKGYKVANNKDAENFDYNQDIEENKTIYVVFVENEKYSLTLYYMVEGDAEHLTQVGEVLEFYSDDAIRYGHELPSMTAKDWFKVQEWYTDEALTAKFVEGTLSDNLTLYANYKFNIGLGDVNADGYVDANDITLYRQWIVGGYTMTEVASGKEWTTVNSQAYATNKASEEPTPYFVIRVADSNALTAESTVLGDEHFDIRDVSTIRMGLVGGYGFAIVEGKTVDGEALLVTRTVTIDSVSDLLAVARSGRAVQLAGDITEENFVGAIVNCGNDVVIDLNGYTITVKSLSISLAENNTGKIEIKNGRINVADGNGVHLSAPAGSIVLDNVTLYDRDGIFELQAADHSLHFNNVVRFLKYNAQNENEPLPAAVKVENGTHVVVEAAAVVTVEKLVVTENFVPSTDADIEITLDVLGQQEIEVEGNAKNEITTLSELTAAAANGGEYKLNADIAYNGTISFTKDTVLDLNGHTLRSGNAIALAAEQGAKLTINGNGNVYAQEACVMAFDGSEIVIENGTFTSYDNFVVGTNGSEGRGNNKITINAGTFNGGIQSAGYVACGIYVANNDTVVVNGGTFNITNGVGILARSGNTTVGENAQFNVTGNGALGKVGDSKVTVPAGEVLVVDYAANYPGGTPTLVNKTAYQAYVINGSIMNLDQLVAAATNGGSYDLGADILTNQQVNVVKDLVLNLDGHTIYNTADIWNTPNGTWSLLSVQNGAELTITGNGHMLTLENDCYALDVRDGAKLTIESGEFVGNIHAVYVHDGELVVNGGLFRVQQIYSNALPYEFTLNMLDENRAAGLATIVVNGGSFYKFNPSNCAAEGAGTNFVSARHYVVEENDIYTVVEYTTVSTVSEIAAVRTVGGHYQLGADIIFGGQLQFSADTTIDLNGHKIQSVNNVALSVTGGATLVIEGEGNVNAVEGCVMAFNGSTVIINGGTYTCSDNFVIGTNGSAGKGENTIIINAGEFNGNIKTAGYVACGIYVANNDTVVVNGGTFNITNGVGILARSGNTTVGENVVFNVTGNGTLGKVGDSKVTVPAGAVLVLDLAAGYPGGEPTLTNNSNYNVVTISNDIININNLADLEAFRDAVNAGNNFAGKTITLNADITLNGAWEPISNYSRKDSANQSKWFAGTFDGNGHTISGLTNANLVAGNITEKEEYTYGLFGSVNNAVIKNLTLTNVSISASNGDSLGALVGYYDNGTQKAEANISNIVVYGSVYGSDNVGGVVGRAAGSYFKALNVIVSGTVEADYKASGLVGTGNAQEMVFENCTNNAAVSSTTVRADNAGYNAAAGISITWKNACQKVVLIECVNTGAISTANTNAITGELAVDYSPQTNMNENGTWTYANGHWTRA